jgi:hypothetical protein
LAKSCPKLSKSLQKVVKKLAESWQKVCKKFVKRLQVLIFATSENSEMVRRGRGRRKEI